MSISKSVPAAVIAIAEQSVTEVRCVSQGPGGVQSTTAGTGFTTASGVITASHVVSGCANGAAGQVNLRRRPATVEVDDPTYDLALVRTATTAERLRLAAGPAAVGQHVVLLGVPGDATNARAEVARSVSGTITARSGPETLSSAEGLRETLPDAVTVSIAPRETVVPGNSGGPAIDAAGNVIGVVEGKGPGGVAYLTPAADLVYITGQ